MENQADQRKIGSPWLSFVMLAVLGAWILDVLSTWIGLSFFGTHEANSIFLSHPYLWLFVVELWILSVHFFKWAPLWIRKIVIGSLMLGSFIPAFMNMVLYWRILLA